MYLSAAITALSLLLPGSVQPTAIYLDAAKLRLAARSSVERILKQSHIWSSVTHHRAGEVAEEELFDLASSEGTTGTVIIENGRATQITLTFHPSRAPSAGLLTYLGITMSSPPTERWSNGVRWKSRSGPYKLINILTLNMGRLNETTVTVDFLSATRFAG